MMETGAFVSFGAFDWVLIATELCVDEAWTRCAEMNKIIPTATIAIQRAFEFNFIFALQSFEGSFRQSVPAFFVPLTKKRVMNFAFSFTVQMGIRVK